MPLSDCGYHLDYIVWPLAQSTAKTCFSGKPNCISTEHSHAKKKGAENRPFLTHLEKVIRPCVLEKLLWDGGVFHAGDVLHQADDLGAVAGFIVVPDVKHEAVTIDDGRLAVDHTGMGGADEVRGDQFR